MVFDAKQRTDRSTDRVYRRTFASTAFEVSCLFWRINDDRRAMEPAISVYFYHYDALNAY